MTAAVVNFVPVSMLEEQVKELAAANKESMAIATALLPVWRSLYSVGFCVV